jgi:hypothetical protein
MRESRTDKGEGLETAGVQPGSNPARSTIPFFGKEAVLRKLKLG